MFRGRWLAGHLIVLAVAGLFVRLGFWQLDRLQEVRARNAQIEARRDLPPVDVAELTRAGTGEESLDRRVTATGEYDADHQAVVLRSLDGAPGYAVLTPLVGADGTGVIVERGWVPEPRPGEGLAPGSEPPEGEVRVTGVVLAGEAGTAASGAGPDGTLVLTNLDVAALARTLPYDVYPVAVRLADQRPAQAGGLPRPFPAGPLDEGPHRSYAVQWFVFAAIGLIGWPILVRHAARGRPGP